MLTFGRHRAEEDRRKIRALTPLGSVQRLKDLHGPLIFLASAASDFVTGQNLLVDGGHSLSTWLVSLERDVPPRVSPDEEIAD